MEEQKTDKIVNKMSNIIIPVNQEAEPEIIDLTIQEEDDAPPLLPDEHPDLKHIRSIREKGEQYEVIPMEIDAFVDASRKLFKDWEIVFTLFHDLKTTNQRLRESLLANDDGSNPQQSAEILRTLDINDRVYNDFTKFLPALEVQKEKLFKL